MPTPVTSVETATPLCACGCGFSVGLARQTETRRGYVKGQPLTFLPKHQWRGKAHPGFNNYRSLTTQGYVLVHHPSHPRADQSGYVREHIKVAEKALGRLLQEKHTVHHVNEIRSDNRHQNLVICEDHDYHMLLHLRMRALKACGHADWIKCMYCKQYGPPDSMRQRKGQRRGYHLTCDNARRRKGP